MISYYYCIDPVLKYAEENAGSAGLITVSNIPVSCHGYREDGFVLANPIHMLRLDDPMAGGYLSQLMAEEPLYHFNMQLLLDEALTVRARNKAVEEALNHAFGNAPLPDAVTAGAADYLRHPALLDMDVSTLSGIYIDFLMNLHRHKEDFSFQRNILGAHTDFFLQQFDGIFEENKGQIRSDILLAFGLRADHDPRKPFDSYVTGGHAAARGKNISEPHELLWAWRECDQYQARRAHDLHRVMSLSSLPRLPNWVRMDIYALMEREAMKNIFAERILMADPALSLLDRCPALRQAVGLSAAGQINDHVHGLFGQLSAPHPVYTGAGLRFFDEAAMRDKESHRVQ